MSGASILVITVAVLISFPITCPGPPPPDRISYVKPQKELTKLECSSQAPEVQSQADISLPKS